MSENQEKRKRRLKLRMNSQFHRGGEIEKRYPGMEEYIHSKRNGKLIRDMEKSVEQLVIVLNRIEKREKKNESVMVVGTTAELGRRRERICQDVDSKKRIRVTRTWVSGMLTNYTNFQNYVQRFRGTKDERKSASEKRWYESHRKGREGFVVNPHGRGEDKAKKKSGSTLPGLIVFRHPNDHGVGRKEARRCGIPTVGVVDSDCKYSERLTYPVPGNDESRVSQMRLMRRIKKVFMKEEKR
jgi:small subunit ribosomal protein S2